MNKVRLGIIGLGNMGTDHSKNLINGGAPELELAAVADLKESRRAWAKENLPDTVQIFESGDELIEKGDIDGKICLSLRI